MRRVLVVNGPNLNLLGTRQPEIYGRVTLAELEQSARAWGAELGMEVESFQSNHEGAIIDRLHQAREEVEGIVINPGALTHTSYALHDALVATGLPAVEVHISNVEEREAWRRVSVTAAACVARIYGRGVGGYRWALRHLVFRAALPLETVSYGDDPEQVADVRMPAGGNPPRGVVALVHGGFWRHEWGRDLMDGLAVDLARRGFATWNVEYRRIRPDRGAWPEPGSDLVAALARLAAHPGVDGSRLVVVGHSAGAQLAVWATRHGDTASRPAVLALLSAITDLQAAVVEGLAGGSVAGLAIPDGELEQASPIALLPLGVETWLVHGADDRLVPPSHCERYAAAAAAAGDPVHFRVFPGVGHFLPIEEGSEPWRWVAERLEERFSR